MVMQTEAIDLMSEFLVTRSPELREKLVLQSVPLVYFLLGRMGISQDMDRDYEDLAHQGLAGLIEAVDHFDPDLKTQFSTYAALRIRGKVIDYLRSSDWKPRNARKRSNKIQNSIFVLWSEKMREPTEQEIAAYLNLTVESVREGLADSNRILISLDTIVDADDGSLHEYFFDETQMDPAETIEQGVLVEKMALAIQNLSERQQLVLSLYYTDGLTFKEISRVLDITQPRVCQLHASAILNLKAMLRDEE